MLKMKRKINLLKSHLKDLLLIAIPVLGTYLQQNTGENVDFRASKIAKFETLITLIKLNSLRSCTYIGTL